jgi:CheY-like chemotaxis protein
MTAHASKDDENLCLAEGMNAFISKPIDFRLSLKVIADVIRQSARP